MNRRKRFWVASIACLCTVAVLTAFGTVAKLQSNSTALTKSSVKTVEKADIGTNGVMLNIKPAKDPSARVNPYAGREAYKNPVGTPTNEFFAQQAAGAVNLTTDLLPGAAPEIREESNSLDVVCNIVQGATAASGFLNAAEGFEFAGWINPGAGTTCAGTPDFPYRIDSVRFRIANAAAFGQVGATGAGTAVYRVNIYGASNCSSDSCANPGVALCNSEYFAFTTANTAAETPVIQVPMNCCVNGPFFVSIEYVSWTGTGTETASQWPSLLWSSSTVVRPACEQYVFNGCTWTGHENFFNAPNGGFYYFTVYGETNAACTPVACATEVVCDVTCPGGATPEGEPTCANEYVDVSNGGCSAETESFGNIACGETVCGTSGTYTVAGGNTRDVDYYEFTLTGTTDIEFCVTAEFCAQALIIQPGTLGCEDAVVLASASEQACSTACVAIRLEAGTYYAFVSPLLFTGVTCGAPYFASLTCAPVLCQPDFTASVSCAGATPAITGNTNGAGDPCGIGIESDLWELTVTAAGSYNFKGCDGPEVYDQYMYLFDEAGCCITFSAEDDDLCGAVGGLSYIRCIDLVPGTYYLLVSGFGAGDVGQYAIAVNCCQPCPIECVDNELETDCADGFVGTNEGCNSDPVSFETITCGGSKCGSWGYYTRNDSAFRDLDWYKISLATDSRITATCTGELPNTLFISTDCPSTIVASATVYECSTNVVSACVAAGDYYIITAPAQGLVDAPCGSNYTLSVACEGCTILDDCPGASIFSQPIDHPEDDWTFGVADVVGDLKRFESFTLTPPATAFNAVTFWGITTATGDFSVCSEDPLTFSIQVWSDLAGVPDIAAGPVCNITTTLNRDPSGLVYLDVYDGYVWTYTWPEGTCCTLSSGWISIQSTSTGTPTDCRFLWGSSGGSTAGSSLLYTAGVLQTPETFDLSMCLAPCPAPCDPVDNLRVIVGPGNVNADLHFTAPQAGTYRLYSTTVPNADDNPDNGADPNYTVETADTFFPAGINVWTVPGGFANYKKFVVVMICD